MQKSRILAMACAAAALAGAVPSQAVVVLSSNGASPGLLSGNATFGVRFRQLNTGASQELFVGHGDLGVAGNRSQADLGWAAANSFTISLSGGTLRATVGATSRQYANVIEASGALAGQPFDTLQVALRDQFSGAGTFNLSGLTLSGTDYLGHAVSNAAVGSIAAVDGGGFGYWLLTGVDFAQDFTLSGSFNRSGAFGNSAEANRLDFTFGNGPVTQPTVPEPATWAMLIAGFGLVGAALRRAKPAHA